MSNPYEPPQVPRQAPQHTNHRRRISYPVLMSLISIAVFLFSFVLVNVNQGGIPDNGVGGSLAIGILILLISSYTGKPWWAGLAWGTGLLVIAFATFCFLSSARGPGTDWGAIQLACAGLAGLVLAALPGLVMRFAFGWYIAPESQDAVPEPAARRVDAATLAAFLFISVTVAATIGSLVGNKTEIGVNGALLGLMGGVAFALVHVFILIPVLRLIFVTSNPTVALFILVTLLVVGYLVLIALTPSRDFAAATCVYGTGVVVPAALLVGLRYMGLTLHRRAGS